MLFFFLVIAYVRGGVTEWSESVDPGSNIPVIATGIFSREDNPLVYDYQPYINFYLDVRDGRKNLPPKSLPVLEAVIYHHTLKRDIGTPDVFFRNEYCCTQDLYETGLCNTLGRILITNVTFLQTTYPTKFQYYQLPSSAMSYTGQAANFTGGLNVEVTGMWYFLVANCDVTDTESVVTVKGTIQIMNPYGYLPGQIATKLPVFWSLAIAFLLLFVIYCILMCVYRNDLMGLQHATALVIFFAFFEAIVLSGGFMYYNFHGYYTEYQPGISAVVSAIKSTAVRCLLLLVALGLSIIREKLPLIIILAMTALTLCYFVFDAMDQFIIVAFAAGRPVNLLYRTMVGFGSLVTNSAYLSWIVVSTYVTMTQLEEQRQSAKAKQYQILGALIVTCLFFSFFLLLLQAALNSTIYADEYFKWMWTWDAYWHFVTFACILTISMIWRPNKNNKAYAFSAQLPQDDPVGTANFPQYPAEADNENGQEHSSESSSEVLSNSEPNVSLDDKDDRDIPLEPINNSPSQSSSSSGTEIDESSV